jgi:hypothetical protein
MGRPMERLRNVRREVFLVSTLISVLERRGVGRAAR